MRCLIVIAVCLLAVAAATRRQRSEPNDWFIDLVLQDQQNSAHDHSGETTERRNHTCCHSMPFDLDLTATERLRNTAVPYNYWWRKGATLISVSPTLDEPANRMLTLGDAGIVLDFVEHSRLYVRLQCAFPCCIEAAEILMPEGAAPLRIVGGNSTVSVEPWRFDPRTVLPPGKVAVGGGRFSNRNLDQRLWADRIYSNRLDALQLCDHATDGAWIEIESPSRVKAGLTEIDVCFVHHDMVADYDSGLCEENK